MSGAAGCGLAGWLRLNFVSSLGPDCLRGLAGRLGLDRIASASVSDLAEAGGLEWEAASRLREDLQARDARREWDQARDLGLRVLAWDEPDYPDCLKSVPDAPLVLYVRGRIEARRDALAIVGSRQPTSYGRRMTRFLVREASARLVIVSGLARGIDTEAHRAALEAGGTTWAVLGSGLARLYPPENASLAREIALTGGCVLSEFPLDAEPRPENFPRRNRVVSGLSWGTVVVEGREHSGSLITARLAVEQGREVFAVPGPADSPLSEAPLRLIGQGAKPVRSMADIWPELPPGCRTAPAAPVAERRCALFALAAPHKKILELLGSETRSLAELGRESGEELSRLAQALFELELEDIIEAVPGQRYAKKEI